MTDKLATEAAVQLIKREFEQRLEQSLSLTKVSAPIAVIEGLGINDDLNGLDKPVRFDLTAIPGTKAEIIQSLAKWKRLRLKEYDLAAGTGIYADMKALRPNEVPGPLHSFYVDQWDWEQVIPTAQRDLDYLKRQVRKIYTSVKETAEILAKNHASSVPTLPQEITFLHSEEVAARYPTLSPKEREYEITRAFGAVFLIGIGGRLPGGSPHDERAPDYDDWTTQTSSETRGLNGDILLWNPVLKGPLEISSMGIRVDGPIMRSQLKEQQACSRLQFFYHQQVVNEVLPQTIGGGIGQSRLCMFLLGKRHIGEVQSGIWTEAYRSECRAKDIHLL